MLIRRLPLLAAAVLLLASAAQAQASEVRSKVAGVAREIAKLLKEKAHTDAAVGEFTGPPVPASSAGPALELALKDELTKLKVTINDGAFIIIKGEYFILDDEKRSDELIVRVLITLRDKKRNPIKELTTDIGAKGNEDIIKLLAISVSNEDIPKADDESVNRRLKQRVENPPPLKLADTKIKASPDSAFAVEVLSRPKGVGAPKVLTPRENKGQAFVDVKKDEEYVLRLHNNSKFEVAVSVTIDGVDAFQFFEPASQRPSSFLIAPGKTRDVSGWVRNTREINTFLVGSFGDSAAAKALRGSARLGTITVCFHPCWEGRIPPPGYEGARNVSPNATGFGPKKEEKSVVVKRTIGPLAAAVSIRYTK